MRPSLSVLNCLLLRCYNNHKSSSQTSGPKNTIRCNLHSPLFWKQSQGRLRSCYRRQIAPDSFLLCSCLSLGRCMTASMDSSFVQVTQHTMSRYPGDKSAAHAFRQSIYVRCPVATFQDSNRVSVTEVCDHYGYEYACELHAATLLVTRRRCIAHARSCLLDRQSHRQCVYLERARVLPVSESGLLHRCWVCISSSSCI